MMLNLWFWVPVFKGITSCPWVNLSKSSQHEKVRAGDMEKGFLGGLLRFLYFLQEHVQRKEARHKAFPTALCPAMTLVKAWEEGNDLVPALRELPAAEEGEWRLATRAAQSLPVTPYFLTTFLSPGLSPADKESAAPTF